MYYLVCILVLSFNSFSQKIDFDSLYISAKKNGKCKYKRNNLNKAQLNNIYLTELKHNLKRTDKEYLTKNFNCIFYKKNLKRDTNKINVPPEKVFNHLAGRVEERKKVIGKIKYTGLIPLKYSYDIHKKSSSSKTQISIKIHFKQGSGFTQQEYRDAKTSIEAKLKEAEGIWESGHGASLDFDFQIVHSKSEADFSVNLKKGLSRGPYIKEWSSQWTGKVVAHEIGHMMGLDDEYDNILNSTIGGLNAFLTKEKNIKGIQKVVCRDYGSDEEDLELLSYFRKMSFGSDRASKCDKQSLMCDTRKGTPQKWHIYTILKRFYLEK